MWSGYVMTEQKQTKQIAGLTEALRLSVLDLETVKAERNTSNKLREISENSTKTLENSLIATEQKNTLLLYGGGLLLVVAIVEGLILVLR